MAQLVDDLPNRFATDRESAVCFDQRLQTLRGGMDGGVGVAAKCAGDLGETVRGELTCEVGNHPSGDNGTSMAAAAEEIFPGDAQTFADRFDNAAESNGDASACRRSFASEEAFDRSRADLAADSVEFDQGAESGDRTFDLTDRARATAGDQIFCRGCQVEPTFACEAADEFRPRSTIRALDAHHHARKETADERLAELPNVARVLVRDEGDACAGEIDGVDRVQEFSLRRGFVREEVNVVDREEINTAKSLAELFERSIADGGDVLVGELLRGDVADDLSRGVLAAATADSLQEVRLADAALAVKEENSRRFSGALRELLACGKREAIRVADDVILESPQGERSGLPRSERAVCGARAGEHAAASRAANTLEVVCRKCSIC